MSQKKANIDYSQITFHREMTYNTYNQCIQLNKCNYLNYKKTVIHSRINTRTCIIILVIKFNIQNSIILTQDTSRKTDTKSKHYLIQIKKENK